MAKRSGNTAVLVAVGEGLRGKRAQVAAALAACGFECVDDVDAAPPSAARMVLFERPADEVRGLVSRLSEGSRRRVVAVSLAPDGLTGSAPWDLSYSCSTPAPRTRCRGREPPLAGS